MELGEDVLPVFLRGLSANVAIWAPAGFHSKPPYQAASPMSQLPKSSGGDGLEAQTRANSERNRLYAATQQNSKYNWLRAPATNFPLIFLMF
jgi:hypothetical protein